MARISYNVLDEDLLLLFRIFLPDVEILEVGGQFVVPASAYQGYLDQIQEELEGDWDSQYWDNWNQIDNEVWIWSTEAGRWV